jgi:hypothetical protein
MSKSLERCGFAVDSLKAQSSHPETFPAFLDQYLPRPVHNETGE